MRFISAPEAALGRKAILEMLPMQPEDVPATCADDSDLERDFGFGLSTTIDERVQVRGVETWAAHSTHRRPHA